MRINFFVYVAFLFVACVSQNASADGLKFSAVPDSKVINDVLARVADEKIRDAVVFREQSFRVNQNGTNLGALVTGRGLVNSADGRDNAACFISFVLANGATNLLQTVGVGEWEAESCIAVMAVGLVSEQSASGSFQLAVLHKAASPNATVVEPVVISWNEPTHSFEIDVKASRKVSLAGATTIKDIRRALQVAR